jgi:xanthine/CO dehydrogenase XdhC/CoxF family maturation factor
MREREQILELWRDARGNNADCVLVTVVKTLGSSYRRPGARLLITESGQRAGSISGGCLEDDVVKKAWWLSEKGPVVRRYDTTPDGEIGPSGEVSGGFGLGCNGIIYLLIQRLKTNPLTLDVLENVYATRQAALLAHVLSPAECAGTYSDSQMPARLRHHAQSVTGSVVAHVDEEQEVFFETLNPPVRLLIFGAGDDAVPLTELARHLGWHVCVFDGRAHYARSERFPRAQQVAVRDSRIGLDDLQMDSRTVAVVMTHSYTQDLNFLKALAKHRLAYVGALGPRNRSEQLLLETGVADADAAALHGPAGLDIGADGPEQVALSIIAEIQASLNGREGGPLRERTGSIHSRESDGGSVRPFVPGIVCA